MSEMTEQYWGYHLILNVGKCDHKAITSYDTIYAFTKELVKDIDMVAFGEPQIIKFGSGNKEGYTLVQLIETSNICAHFVDETDEAYIDVFSCKMFDFRVVQQLVTKHFKTTTMDFQFIQRRAPTE